MLLGLRVFWGLAALPAFFLCQACEKRTQPAPNPPRLTLRIHAWEGYAREHAPFFQQYLRETRHQEVDLVITSTTGLDSNIEAIRKGGAHIVSPSNDLVVPLWRQNLLLPLDPKRLPHFNQINPIILATRCTMVGDRYFAIPFNFGAYLLAYNRAKVPPPNSYRILWAPAFRKRVTIPAMYATVNIYMTALMLGFPKEDLFNLSDAQLELIQAKLTELNHDQVAEFWETNIVPSHHYRFDIGMDWGIGVLKINEQFGGNWGVVIPQEGATAWVDAWSLTINIKDPETEALAYSFLDFMLRPESQARMARVTSYGPVNPYSTRFLTTEEKRKYYLTDPKFFNNFILWQPLSEKNWDRYRRVWLRSRGLPDR